MSDSVKLIECFRTFQGEGPDAGRAVLLLRFKRCNMKCHFCDTQVKMRISNEGVYQYHTLQKQLSEYRLDLLITGGEPTFQSQYHDTIKLLTNLTYYMANVETNGYGLENMLSSRDWRGMPIKFIYSPKILDVDTQAKAFRLTEKILCHPNVYIKMPYLTDGYCDVYCHWLESKISALEHAALARPEQLANKVWLMPVGCDLNEQIEASAAVMDACEKYKFNFSGRLHTMYNFM